MLEPSDVDRDALICRLAVSITGALQLPDMLELSMVGIRLDGALVALRSEIASTAPAVDAPGPDAARQ